MVLQLQFPMEKHMSNHNGFTLLETLIVLSIISMMMIISPLQNSFQTIQIQQDIMVLYEFLLRAQNDAILYHRHNEVILNQHRAYSLYETIDFQQLNMMYQSFHFNEKGHISKACTIRFVNSERQIVAQLGSGSLDLR